MNSANAATLRLISNWLMRNNRNNSDSENSSEELNVCDENGEIVVEKAELKLASNIKVNFNSLSSQYSILIII